MKHYVMIGAPIGSVRSPPLLQAVMAERGVAASVIARHVDPDDLARFMAQMRNSAAIDGLIVTMPHKRAIVPALDALTDLSTETGTVNAVKRLGDRLVGAQFDGVGLRCALVGAGADLPASTIWLAGVGGAGIIIARALVAAGCRSLLIAETDRARAEAVAAPLGAVARVLDAGEAPRADILVNATPLGMRPDDPSPFPPASVAAASLVADIVAVPNETRLADTARAARTPLVTGLEMVRHQIPHISDWLLSHQIEQPR